MTLTSGLAKLNLAIFICFISETLPNRFLDAANICTNRLQLVLRHNESYTVSINSNNSSNRWLKCNGTKKPFPHLQFMAQSVPPPQIAIMLGKGTRPLSGAQT